ncbi:hypothetical protein PIB30_035829 [Stylosanthes scabra]|uniref:Uncharacterized protein n=1 Tax=Stylosanthes scabra TaxID=79078 RepID=A0ABU6YBL3_9FABA|nr:hypothetical protein [Stylosanthes scabra]
MAKYHGSLTLATTLLIIVIVIYSATAEFYGTISHQQAQASSSYYNDVSTNYDHTDVQKMLIGCVNNCNNHKLFNYLGF